MRKTSFLFSFFFCLASYSIFAQTALLRGRVLQGEADSILVVVNPNPLSAREAQSAGSISAQGLFSFTVPLPRPTVADLVYGEDAVSIFLQPGDQLEARFKAGNVLQTLKFQGPGAHENNFLVAYARKFEEDEDYQVLPHNISLSEADFVSFLDDRRQHQLQFLKKYHAKTPLSAAFRHFMQAEIEYGWANDRLTFAELRQKVNGGAKMQLSPSYYDYLGQVRLSDPQALGSYAYATFLKNYLQFLAATTRHQKTDPDYYQVLYHLAKEKLSGEARDLLLAYTLHESVKYGPLAITNQLLRDFEQLNSPIGLQDFLAGSYEVNQGFALGSPAPDFKLKSLAGKEMSLADFKGQVVCLHFWRSKDGQAPARRPDAREWQELTGGNVVVVNIGVDEDEAQWRRAAAAGKLPGLHLYGGQQAGLLKQYKLTEVPAYYLLDTDGTFISTKARRPGSDGGSNARQALRR